MIKLEIMDLDVVKHIEFRADVDPVAWSLGPINTDPDKHEFTKSGKRKKVTVGESESAHRFKEAFSLYAAQHRISSNSPLYKNTPVLLCFNFFMPRPKALKDGPALPLVRPDLTNMQKLAEDVLTGLFWADDNTTVSIFSNKQYVSIQGDKPYIMVDIFYCRLVTAFDRTGGFGVKRKEDDMVIVDGHLEENNKKADASAKQPEKTMNQTPPAGAGPKDDNQNQGSGGDNAGKAKNGKNKNGQKAANPAKTKPNDQSERVV